MLLLRRGKKSRDELRLGVRFSFREERIPELQLFPPAFSSRTENAAVPQTLTNPGHLVEALAWPRHAVEEGSGSSYAPTSRTPPVLLNLLSPWQASSSNIVDHPALQTPPSEISSSNLVAHNPASRTPTLQAPSSEPIADNPTFQTLEGGPITVLPVPSELRGQISVSRYIPAFRQMPGGRTWGPYLVGMPLFLQQSYPLSTYLSFSISTKVPTLMSVRTTIWDALQSRGVSPGLVSTLGTAMQGDYLWPPVEIVGTRAGALDIPAHMRSQRIRQAISERLGSHSRLNPSLFNLKVQVDGVDRHRLVVPVRDHKFVHVAQAPEASQLWLFFEGVWPNVHYGLSASNRLTFLGATYLRRYAEKVLLEANVAKVAFPSLAA
ncbi:hypothetical protein [Sporisorium scitamineum]|uniref:Uncharacterized protein n=1 Tax=Sporisorium scitamineum TaxID=49012 RepID=A0A0F7S2E5_9BASI|nr:hypothetical protein [Sporisorium scitamineum]